MKRKAPKRSPKTFEKVEGLSTGEKVNSIANGLRLLAEVAEFVDCEEFAPLTDEESFRLFLSIQVAASEPDVEAWFRSHGTEAMFRLAQFRETLSGWRHDWKQITDMEADVLAFADWLDMLASASVASSPLMPDDWVQVKLKMIKQTTTTVTTHCKKHPDRIRWQSDGVYLIRRKYLERYLEGWDLKHCLEKAGSLDSEV